MKCEKCQVNEANVQFHLNMNGENMIINCAPLVTRKNVKN